MALLGIDIGGTKIAAALFTEDGSIISKWSVLLRDKKGSEVGSLIKKQIIFAMKSEELKGEHINSIGISVPGISYKESGIVWAPNIPGWDNYPLLDDISIVTTDIPVTIDSDRACHLLGEFWMGNARGYKNVIFMAVGTGIGAGIMVNGEILRGSNDIAGSIGWMALSEPFKAKYTECGCFEYHASGEGIAKVARAYLRDDKDYNGELRDKKINDISSLDIMTAYRNKDILAIKVIEEAIRFWGMAAANLVSIFNPEKIIFGGGVFGPAKEFLPRIRKESLKWAQPVSIKKVTFDTSALGSDAGLYGAAYLALESLPNKESMKNA